MQQEELQFYFFKKGNNVYFCSRIITNKSYSYNNWIKKINNTKVLNACSFDNLIKRLNILAAAKLQIKDISVEEFIGKYYQLFVVESNKLNDFFCSYYKYKSDSIYEKLIDNKLYIIYKNKGV